jgi:hypothetical protein
VRTFCTSSRRPGRAARAADTAASPALPLRLPLRRAKRRVGWRENGKIPGPPKTCNVHDVAALHVQLVGSRSVIVRGGQNLSRAPSASAPPICDS